MYCVGTLRGNARAEHTCRRAACCVVRGGASKTKREIWMSFQQDYDWFV